MKQLLSLIFIALTLASNGQKLDSLEVSYISQESTDSILGLKCRNPEKALINLIRKHQEEGYLTSSIDTTYTKNKLSVFYAHIFLGEKILADNNINLSEREDLYLGVATQPSITSYGEIKKRLINLENSGYPFAQVKISGIDSSKNTYRVELIKGPLIKLDSIIGINSPVKNSYLKNYLSLKISEPYNEQKIRDLKANINRSSFMQMKKPPSVIFIKNKAKLYMDLNPKKANRFDGIIGIQPSAIGKTTITGLVNLSLVNSFKRGEEIDFNWERLLAQNQRLKLKSSVPYLFKSKIGFSFQANIIRQDSTLNRSLLDYDIFYDFSSNMRLSFGIESAKNNTNISESIAFQNTSSTLYSVAFFYKKLNYNLNPRKGVSFASSGLIGERKTVSLEKTSLINTRGEFNCFIPLLKKTTLLVQFQGESLNSPGLFSNELVQIGGLNFIRGVDQRSLNVSSWITSTLEYRYLFDTNSNFFVFTEAHWNEVNLSETYSNNQISALGLGISVGTGSGIFSFNYAISNQSENKFLLRNAKINFGFSSSF